MKSNTVGRIYTLQSHSQAAIDFDSSQRVHNMGFRPGFGVGKVKNGFRPRRRRQKCNKNAQKYSSSLPKLDFGLPPTPILVPPKRSPSCYFVRTLRWSPHIKH